MEYNIELKNLSTGYRSRKATTFISSGLNAYLRKGELTCLLGPNGAGKSTLLRTLSGFQQPLSGSVEVMGRNISDYKPADLSRLIGIVLTDNSRISNMSVKEVVAMGRSPYTGFWGKLSAKDIHLINKCMENTGILQFADRKIQTLSDGERQKVMIAKSMAQETPVILLDEPTAFLDYPSKIQTLLFLRRLAEAQHKAILVSTHDLEHAIRFADNLWLLDKEHGLTVGTPEQLTANGTIESYFHIEELFKSCKSQGLKPSSQPSV